MASLTYRRLRAPREDGTIFCEPAGKALAEMIAANRQLVQHSSTNPRGDRLQSIRNAARSELIAKAVDYTGNYLDTRWGEARDKDVVFLAGHQPELFHPGVWLKNFTLSAAAIEHNAVAINLLIDNDDCRQASIGVPILADGVAKVVQLAFDAPMPPRPWEERAIVNRSTLKDFASRVNGPFGDALRLVAEVEPNLGRCLAQARHRVEWDWGSRTLELPLSQLCGGNAFQQFCELILADLAEFATIYNGALQEYRDVHRLRTAAQPLPDLALKDGRWETPFWVWTQDDPQRRALYGRPSEVDNVRPRALITTLFARVVLSDLFIHGIGGAKYDQITDLIIDRFFGLSPPGFMTVSGTLLLPQPVKPDGLRCVGEIEKQLRDCEHHPEKHLSVSLSAEEKVEAEKLASEKQALVRRQDIDRATKHEQLTSINGQLRRFSQATRDKLQTELADAQSAAQIASVFSSREYAFCLHPPDSLRRWLLDSAKNAV